MWNDRSPAAEQEATERETMSHRRHPTSGRAGQALVLPVVVVLLWLFVGGPLGSFAGRLAEVQKNDNARSCRRAPSRPGCSTSSRVHRQQSLPDDRGLRALRAG